MKGRDIADLLSLGEGQQVEFKLGLPDQKIVGRTVCGFLNSSGGFLVCGVANDGRVVGIEVSERKLQGIEAALQKGLSPGALVSLEVQQIGGKGVLVVEVPAGQDLPYAYDNVIYIRQGESTRQADVATIRDLVLRKQIEPERWERRFSFADMETDLDLEELHSAVRDVGRERGNFLGEGSDPVKVLGDLSVAKYGRLTNAGDVLFCSNPAQRLPQVRVRAACYATDKAGAKFLDQRSLEGPLGAMLEETYSFIVRNTPNRSSFSSKSIRREDAPLYPAEAVREALVNAFAHRDYSGPSGGITVGVFPDRLEIWNSGGLPQGVTIESLAKGQLSILRNPDIAHVLYLRGLMERLGRGSVLIVRACEEQGLPAPRWTSDERSGVTLIIFAPPVTPHVPPQVTPHVGRLLGLLEGEMSREELMGAMGVSDAKHFRSSYLRPALDQGLVEMTQPDKPKSVLQRYRLSDLGRQVKSGL